MNEVTTEAPNKGNGLLIAFGVIALLALGVGAYFFFTGGMNETGDVPEGDAVAIVNGTTIDRATYDRSVTQITGSYTAQGIDTTSAEVSTSIRDQALSALINRQLMVDAATNAGMTASDEEVEAEFQTAVTNMGGAENLNVALSDIGMNETDLRADLRKDVMINKYLDQKLNLQAIVVTDEEVQAAYDTAAETNEQELPAFEDVKELIRNQLTLEQQQVLINAELETLRAAATIQVI